jgi:hypothetical protein
MKHAENPIILRDISTFHGAEYNPRKMIPERLQQVATSLRKLGFVLPIYVNKNGVILSGHQRTTAAKLVGYTKIPVVELDVPDSQEKGMNVVFNKGTNDLDTFATNAESAFEDYLVQAGELSANLPDIEPDTYYPCMHTKTIDMKTALSMAGNDVPQSLRGAGFQMISAGIYMPLVVCGDRILNGKGRVYGYTGRNFDSFTVVEVSPEQADYAYRALNFLAMDFDIQSHFKEELRYNAFRRKGVGAQIVGLSRTYPYFVYGKIISNGSGKYAQLEGLTNTDLQLLPTANEESRLKFQNTYGKVMFDMGAGTLHDANLMKDAGFDITPFEPFYCGPESTPQVDLTRALITTYLDKLESLTGKGPDSIVSSFVLNSIPHHEDRMAYLTILAAMSKIHTKVFIGTQNVKSIGAGLSAHLRITNGEPNMTLGTSNSSFKAQKFYRKDELEKMLKVFFAEVKIKEAESNVFAECRYPRRVPPKLLREALELEFNMPYKGGERMNLHERAIEVFSKYTGMAL